MKKLYIYLTVLATALMLSTACNREELNSQSIFDDNITETTNEFDEWLQTNYVEPYNIVVKYRFEDKESSTSYNLAPADIYKSFVLAKLTKFLWLESYEELLGDSFIRTYCPKVLNMIGSYAYNSSGSVVLGTAESGMKITLYNVNNIDPDNLDIDFLNYWFFKTMHHEFAHILHQTKEYSTDFNLISLDYQSSSWVNIEDQEALDMGFISPYASSEPREDFVELISIYVTNTAEDWEDLVGSASEDGQDKINQKFAIVKDYLWQSWGIDIDELRDIVQRRSALINDIDFTL